MSKVLIPRVTLEQAQSILDKYLDRGGLVVSVEDLARQQSSSSSSPGSFYVIRLDDTRMFALRLDDVETPNSKPSYMPNSTASQYKLLSHLCSQPQTSSMPLLSPIAFDDSRSVISQAYLLAAFPSTMRALISLSAARPSMSAAQSAIIDLKVGSLLHNVHDVQNDWFGPPTMESDALWSWQEAFTFMLGEVLSSAEEAGGYGVELDYTELRHLLSRAIGAFIFDDVEVPSFIWFMGGEEDVYISLHEGEGEPEIVLVLADLSFSMWGDPLLERLFIDPEPSQALLEGYKTPLILYPRQRTKHLWYKLYAALVVLLAPKLREGRRNWASEAATHAAKELKDSPCY